MKRSPKRAVWCTVTAFLLVGAAACGGSSASSAGGSASGSPIQIGFDDALTGSAAVDGQANLIDAKAAAGYINSQGGINGRQVKLTVMDSGEIGSGGAGTNATQLAQDKVSAIFGPFISNDCDSVAPIVAENKIPDICVYADYDTLVPSQAYLYQSSTPEVTLAKPMIEEAEKLTGKAHPRIAVIGAADQGAEQLESKVSAIAPQLGASVVSVGTEALTATDLSPLGAKAITAKPDVIFLEVFPQFAVPLVKQFRGALPASVPIIALWGTATYQTMQTLNDPHLYGVSGTQLVIPGAAGNTTQANELAAQFKKVGAGSVSDINGSSGTEPVAAYLDLLEAMKACGGCTGAALSAQLEKTSLTVPGLVSGFQYSASAHSGYHNYYFYGWDTGKKQTVLAGQQATGSLSLTVP